MRKRVTNMTSGSEFWSATEWKAWKRLMATPKEIAVNLLDQLKVPFPVKSVHWRVGATNKSEDDPKGIALAYVDARDVMIRLDTVCETDWQCRYSHVTPKGVVCEIGIKIEGEWVWRSNGAGETDVEGEKGALSDAFKRAAVLWGIGRYLYMLPNTWVALKKQGRSFVVAETPQLPSWATPEGFIAARRAPDLSENLSLERAVKTLGPSITAIKEGIAEGNLPKAAEAYFELNGGEKSGLKAAPTKHLLAPFTTAELKVIESTDFRQAHYGVES
jgi:hypothetical protein